jgi:7,8-dihydroneopterin aldolase/epimerase/oxygenase
LSNIYHQYRNIMREQSLVRLTVRSAEFYAYHGVKSEEQALGGKYQVDLDLYYDGKQAVINDDVNYAINYDEAMFCIEEFIGGDSFNLIETIANEILNMLMDRFPILVKATVRVRKMNAPIRRIVSYVEAEQTMTRTAPDK